MSDELNAVERVSDERVRELVLFIAPRIDMRNSHYKLYDDIVAALTELQDRRRSAGAGGLAVTEETVKHMAERFLRWRLPENFRPDAGISFEAEYNQHTAHPARHEPTGTNLFDFTQATEMVRHMVEGLPLPGDEAAIAERIVSWLESDDENVRPDAASEKTKALLRNYRLKLAKAIRDGLPALSTPDRYAEGFAAGTGAAAADWLAVLQELAGYVQDGSNDVVTIAQDDATKDWYISTRYSKRSYYSSSLKGVLLEAARSLHPEPTDESKTEGGR